MRNSSKYFVYIFMILLSSCTGGNEENPFTVSFDDVNTINFKSAAEIRARLYLAEKYNPGDCFGMPGVQMYQKKINQQCFQIMKKMLYGKSDNEVERIIRQMDLITLTQAARNKYKFEFRDGRCCNIIYYKGTLEIWGSEVIEKIIETHTRIVPC